MDEDKNEPNSRKRLPRLLRIFLVCFGTLVVLGGLFILYAYKTTPAAVRRPAFQHYHFRMQILVDNKAVGFAGKSFQTDTAKDICSADLTSQPVHFHDDKDQIVHIHWDSMTGGLVLKYYGWNYSGGLHGTLGFRFDQLPKLVNVPIHGNTLPTVPQGDSFYVYSGDQHSFKERSFDDFVRKDLENFFGKKSDLFGASASSTNPSQNELQKVNNLIGNVVIFVQKDKPTSKQVKDRFNKLAPLSLSTCAG